MPDPVRRPPPRDLHAARIARDAAIRKAERTMETAAHGAIGDLLGIAHRELAAAGYDPSVLDVRHPEWQAVVESQVLPAVTAAYVAGLHLEAMEGTIDATAYSVQHLENVRNRLVGVGDTVFDTIRTSLRDGMLQGEDVRALARRTDDLLGDAPRWRNRAVTIARTEVIAANNAGQRDAARIIAGATGHDVSTVVKQWLATSDERTRETHAAVNGVQVLGLDAPFSVGAASLQQPGDPYGPAREVVNCRCTVLHLLPGDPGYPDEVGGVPTAPPRAAGEAPAADLPDVGTLDDAALEDEMMSLAALGDYTSDRAIRLAAELDRRDAINLDALPAEPDAVVEQVFVDQALVRDLTQTRLSTTRRRGRSESREEQRADYEAYIDSEYLRAIADTNGNMLSKRSLAEGHDARDLFTKRLRSLPTHATEELQRWFAANPRLSFDEWRGRKARSAGWESEFG